jgi:hypothetical protein
MSRSRVSLSNWEKEQRGEMISCMTNTNTGSWGICCATQQPSRPANNNYRPPNNNQDRQPVNNAKPLPFQQQPQPQAQASCPNVNNLPPVEACAGRSSNCWSVGQTDVDCPGFALCCFDGCANTCQGGGGTAPRSIRGR